MELMARGWESKAVEAQIESAETLRGRSQAEAAHKAAHTLEKANASRKLDSLLLHRTRVLSDLTKCRDERYRKTLSDGLKYLEVQLTALGWHA
jgi:hypothetical protein